MFVKCQLEIGIKPYSGGYSKNRIISFKSGSTVLASLRRDSATGLANAYRGDGATLLGSSVTSLALDNTYRLEIRYKPHGSTGVFQVKINGVLEINFTGNTTSGATTYDTFAFETISGQTGIGYIDNVIIDDAVWPGNTRIQAIKPLGAGSLTQWDPSAGANWQCVDEAPASEADYVSAGVVDKMDLYEPQDLSGVIGVIKCVQLQARCVKEGAPAATQLQLAVRTGGTNYVSGSKAVATITPKPVANVWNTNPATGQPWTAGEVNALEMGIKAAA